MRIGMSEVSIGRMSEVWPQLLRVYSCGERSWILMRGPANIATRIASFIHVDIARSLSVVLWTFLSVPRSRIRKRVGAPISAVPGNWDVIPKLTMRKATGTRNRSSTVGSYESILERFECSLESCKFIRKRTHGWATPQQSASERVDRPAMINRARDDNYNICANDYYLK